jgi:hypothetical protein
VKCAVRVVVNEAKVSTWEELRCGRLFGAEAEICGMANEGGVRNSVSGRSHRVAGVFLDSAPSKNSAATFYALFLSVSLGLE